MEDEQVKKQTTIGLYTPSLQGFYVGELVNQIRQLCLIKNYNLVIIRTGGFGEFDSEIHMNQMDGAIMIRNSVAPSLAETLIQKQVHCVSVAFDYYPLKIPVVSSDNEAGMRLAFNHLVSDKHESIAYIADLSQYDLRKRYESYCDLHEEYNLQLNDELLFTVDNALMAGGETAANQFIQKKCTAKGVIFGSSLIAIGFIQKLKKKNISTENMGFICFDAVSLTPVLAPELASIDQNLNLIAYRCLNVIEAQKDKRSFTEQSIVEPKLVQISSSPEDCYDSFLATCVDLPELHNPNYVKCLLANMYDWPNEVAQSNLDQLMSLAPLFKRFLSEAHISRSTIDNNKQGWIKHSKSLTSDKVLRIEVSDGDSLCKANAFPPRSIPNTEGRYDLCIHTPIVLQGKIWGFLTTYGRSIESTVASSFFGFSGYLENLVKTYQQSLEIKQLKKRLDKLSAKNTDGDQDKSCTIRWNVETDVVTWSDNALNILGFTSDMECNIYRNMDITDRVHPKDVEVVRIAVNNCHTRRNPISIVVSIKSKRGKYLQINFSGEPRPDSVENDSCIVFFIGLNDDE